MSILSNVLPILVFSTTVEFTLIYLYLCNGNSLIMSFKAGFHQNDELIFTLYDPT